MIGHAKECPVFDKMLEAEDYDLVCFCAHFLFYMGNSGLPFLKDDATRIMKLLQIFHYNFYVKDKLGLEGSSADSQGNGTDEGDSKELRIVE